MKTDAIGQREQIEGFSSSSYSSSISIRPSTALTAALLPISLTSATRRDSNLGFSILGSLLLLCFLFYAFSIRAAGFVYETPGEFLTSGDFNGDGLADVLVLDKATGNARVGYQDSNSNLVWSAPLPTGVLSPAALAVGHFRDTAQDAIGVTSADLNRIHLLRLSDPTNPPVPAVLTPQGVGPDFLVGLASPFGVVSNFDSLAIGSSANDANLGLTLLELFGFVADAQAFYQDSIAQQAYLTSGNSLMLGTDPVSYAAAMQRDTNDTFVAFSPSNHFATILSLPGLPSGSAYGFGTFYSEPLPRFFFYVPGQSNLVIYSLVPTNGAYVFDSGIAVALGEAVLGVYYVSRGSDGVAVIQFGDGVQGLTLPGGSPVLSGVYRSGTGAGGNTFTGVVPLGAGNFALMDGPPGSPSAAHAQVVNFDGANFRPISAGNLPALTTRNTRANVWVFQTEPFVSNDPGFISSLNAPDWSSGANTSSGALMVLAEIDGGPAPGLQNPTNDNLGTLPAGGAWALGDQYRDSISLFSYASPRAPEAITINIAPAPGLYGGPIQISFTTLNPSDTVFYRAGSNANYQSYTVPFTLTNDVTVQYFGANSSSGLRSRLYAAGYSFGRAGIASPVTPVNLTPGATNPAPVFQTNHVILSDIGTIFYGRRGSNNIATIWSINLDGSGETLITTGARPRVSRDGQWLAFLRGDGVFANQGDLWVRNLATDQETLLFVANPDPSANTNTIMCYDWDLSETNLIFDYDNTFWRLGLDGSVSQFPLPSSYNQGAPSVNPVDGRVAFHSLYPAASALYLTPADLSSEQLLLFSPSGARWPAWDPDGDCLAFSDGYVSPSVDDGKDLWVAEILGNSVSNLFRITDLADSINGFPHGATWSPQGDALVSAGTIGGTNGLWVIPLNPECMCSDEPVRLLPTALGDRIDFAGSIVALPAPPGVVAPGLFIRLNSDTLTVYWSGAYLGFTLETTTDLVPPAFWTPLPGPYAFDGYYNTYSLPVTTLLNKQFFRLHYTGTPH